MTRRYQQPLPLGPAHIVDSFMCRSTEQTEWLRRYSRQSGTSGSTRVFVVTEVGSPHMVAYYAWCMAQVHPEVAPARMRKGGGRYPQPVALLARLGVDTGHEGQGLAAGMLQDVFMRLVAIVDGIGCRGVTNCSRNSDQ